MNPADLEESTEKLGWGVRLTIRHLPSKCFGFADARTADAARPIAMGELEPCVREVARRVLIDELRAREREPWMLEYEQRPP